MPRAAKSSPSEAGAAAAIVMPGSASSIPAGTSRVTRPSSLETENPAEAVVVGASVGTAASVVALVDEAAGAVVVVASAPPPSSPQAAVAMASTTASVSVRNGYVRWAVTMDPLRSTVGAPPYRRRRQAAGRYGAVSHTPLWQAPDSMTSPLTK